MTFDALIHGLSVRSVVGRTTGVALDDITCDSREVKPGSLFIATRGSIKDSHRYIEAALQQGAAGVILDDETFMDRAGSKTAQNVPFVLLNDAKAALPKIAAVFFGNPQERVRLVGITGTNGKTTTSYLIKSIVAAAGAKCGIIGTIGYQIGDDNVPFANTTPGVITLFRILKKMADAGLGWVAMEVSSHALDQGRVGGLTFRVALFTNLTQDHLDYHKTMDAYFEAKKKLFGDYGNESTAAIINADDAFGQKLIRDHSLGKILTYGFTASAQVMGKEEKLRRDSSFVVIMTPRGPLEVTTPLVGRHNLYNILAAVAFGVSQGIDSPVLKRGIETMARVPGRLERIDSDKGFSVYIDYAHTDDALKNVLESLRQIPHNGRIITVFGCGGDRDRGKRPLMGRVVTDLSDYCIMTSDNPRSEDPQAIVGDIVAGVINKNFEIVIDRREAIGRALALAGEGDFVLVAGKGHENTQTIKGRVLPFDDKVIVAQLLKAHEHV